VYVSGIEPDPDARAAAQRLHGIALKTEQSLKEFNAASFSVITLWHVLEHLHDLNDNISSIKRLLKDSGKLIVAVPNHTSYDAQYYKEYWAAYDVPRHLYHFNPDSIGRLFEKHGFVLETTKPMKWDAYYVSMLSEKYKSGSTNYLNSFFRAFVSNARAHHSRFSSQIYILSKNRI
jgi:predicted SAM-dependent methyltransferase